MIKLSSLQNNKNNPRYITADKLEKLKASIESFEQMLEARPIVTDEDGVILGGNMRYEALKALGYKEIPAAWVKTLTGLTDEQKREFLIKDNVNYGEWNYETLANEWNYEILNSYGLEVLILTDDEELINIDDDIFSNFLTDEEEVETLHFVYPKEQYKNIIKKLKIIAEKEKTTTHKDTITKIVLEWKE